MQPVTEALREPLIEIVVVAANESEHLGVLFGARQRIHKQMPSTLTALVLGLRVAQLSNLLSDVLSHAPEPPGQCRKDRVVPRGSR